MKKMGEIQTPLKNSKGKDAFYDDRNREGGSRQSKQQGGGELNKFNKLNYGFLKIII